MLLVLVEIKLNILDQNLYCSCHEFGESRDVQGMGSWKKERQLAGREGSASMCGLSIVRLSRGLVGGEQRGEVEQLTHWPLQGMR